MFKCSFLKESQRSYRWKQTEGGVHRQSLYLLTPNLTLPTSRRVLLLDPAQVRSISSYRFREQASCLDQVIHLTVTRKHQQSPGATSVQCPLQPLSVVELGLVVGLNCFCYSNTTSGKSPGDLSKLFLTRQTPLEECPAFCRQSSLHPHPASQWTDHRHIQSPLKYSIIVINQL